MIDLSEYNIKVRYFAIHPAGEVNGDPFIVRTQSFPRNMFPNIYEWRTFFESLRNQELIIHELTPFLIRYSIVLPMKG